MPLSEITFDNNHQNVLIMNSLNNPHYIQNNGIPILYTNMNYQYNNEPNNIQYNIISGQSILDTNFTNQQSNQFRLQQIANSLNLPNNAQLIQENDNANAINTQINNNNNSQITTDNNTNMISVNEFLDDSENENMQIEPIETASVYQQNVRRKETSCACGSTSHKRKTYHSCPLNPYQNSNGYFYMSARKKFDQKSHFSPTVVLDKSSPNYGRFVLNENFIQCPDCKAQMWPEEQSDGTICNPKFSTCCLKGRVKLPESSPLPSLFTELLTGNQPINNHFKSKIRLYNSIFAFTSFRAQIDEKLASSRSGVYTFRLNGTIYHHYSDLGVQQNNKPKFAQIYFYDSDQQVDFRTNLSKDLDKNLVISIQNILIELNPFIKQFAFASAFIKLNPFYDLKILIKDHNTKDPRRYNNPNSSDFAAIFYHNELNDNDYKREVILHTRESNRLKIINDTHQSYDPLHYVLMYPNGQHGWAPQKYPLLPPKNINQNRVIDNQNTDDSCSDSEELIKEKFITALQFYSFRLQIRENSCLQLYGRLFHQFCVDMYVKIENSRLKYIQLNQDKLRSNLYQGLADAINNDDYNLENLGKKVVLPSSFQGGPRHMLQLYQDAMAIVRFYGKPDLFITFTCNPNWPDLKVKLNEFQQPLDRPDLIVRIFKLKLKELMYDLTKREIFGSVKSYIYVIEFQKRGLPHCHILLILNNDSKFRTAKDVDLAINAQIPDPNQYPLAYRTVINSMIHGPCGNLNPNSSCMKNGICSKKYPRAFTESTILNSNGYPIYKRSANSIKVKINGKYEVDNSFVVPHNLLLATKYDAHINVEICSTVKAVKYLYKYVYKGHDRIEIDLRISDKNIPIPRNLDECSRFRDSRYVSAIESCWRIFHYQLYSHTPAVYRLAIHLENQQNVVINTQMDPLVQLHKSQKTTLTAWFDFNQKYEEIGRNLCYHEMPSVCVWEKNKREWKIRRKVNKNVIGRMYYTSITDFERYCLRLILIHKKGAKSFEDLRTVNNHIHDTYKSAALAMGLIEDDKSIIQCLNEAYTILSNPNQFREFFVQILMTYEAKNVNEIWEIFKEKLSEDIWYQYTLKYSQNVNDFIQEILNLALKKIHDILLEFDAPINLIEQLPKIDNTLIQIAELPQIIRQELNYPNIETSEFYEENYKKLNPEQLAIFKTIISPSNRLTNAFFIDGPGGTGKTFLYNTILAYFRSKNKIAISVASSGIAALLLNGGRTAHSRFKIPINIHEDSISSIELQSEEAKLIRLAEIIIWDEAPMMNRYVFECFDRLLKDIMKQDDPSNNKKPFGGKKVCLGGDFRQILPVILHGGKLEILSVTLIQSYLWPHIKPLSLRKNMRIYDDELNKKYADFLLKIGKGEIKTEKIGNYEDFVRLPDELCLNLDLDELVKKTYPELEKNFLNSDFILNRAILSTTNNEVDKINEFIIQKFPGEEHVYFSVNKCLNDKEDSFIPTEYLNSLNISGLPPHNLKLKLNQPIILIRNICPQRSLCNGTRLIIRGLYSHLIKAEIAFGIHKGRHVLIPKMKLNPSENVFPFNFERFQFPIRPAFAITINKSQGQTLKFVGIYLNEPCFTHGQLYVALSRVTNVKNIKIACENGMTRNVVYKEFTGKRLEKYYKSNDGKNDYDELIDLIGLVKEEDLFQKNNILYLTVTVYLQEDFEILNRNQNVIIINRKGEEILKLTVVNNEQIIFVAIKNVSVSIQLNKYVEQVKKCLDTYNLKEINRKVRSDRMPTNTLIAVANNEKSFIDILKNGLQLKDKLNASEPWVFKPLQCLKCGQLGHKIIDCDRVEFRCLKCSKSGHETEKCEASSKDYCCINCLKNTLAISECMMLLKVNTKNVIEKLIVIQRDDIKTITEPVLEHNDKINYLNKKTDKFEFRMIANSNYIAENLNSFKSFLQELDKSQVFNKTRSLEEHNEIKSKIVLKKIQIHAFLN
ncbi:unnamed protein product [Brachionus calyciflorus]|uniref:ATP-dependent DNA helicase n=1 Tax=Brachionus calyciflorus TaxID=104777 RepID=A0A813YEY1_9BILA|nr:unnamed protein product [Brachionus calyciflorus]